jgi:hypothetical protein
MQMTEPDETLAASSALHHVLLLLRDVLQSHDSSTLTLEAHQTRKQTFSTVRCSLYILSLPCTDVHASTRASAQCNPNVCIASVAREGRRIRTKLTVYNTTTSRYVGVHD